MKSKKTDTIEATKITELKDIPHEIAEKPPLYISDKEAKDNPIQKREVYYQKTAKYFNRALKIWVKGLKSKNEQIRLNSANQIMSRILPVLKNIEVSNGNGEPIRNYQIIMGNGFIPPSNEATLIEVRDDTVKEV